MEAGTASEEKSKTRTQMCAKTDPPDPFFDGFCDPSLPIRIRGDPDHAVLGGSAQLWPVVSGSRDDRRRAWTTRTAHARRGADFALLGGSDGLGRGRRLARPTTGRVRGVEPPAYKTGAAAAPPSRTVGERDLRKMNKKN